MDDQKGLMRLTNAPNETSCQTAHSSKEIPVQDAQIVEALKKAFEDFDAGEADIVDETSRLKTESQSSILNGLK